MSAPERLSSLSTEYLKIGPVRIEENGELIDPTAATVEVAFTAGATDEPEEDEWVEGSWESGGGRHFARVLVGPSGAVAPGNGTWSVWIRLTRSPEIIVQPVGRVVIT